MTVNELNASPMDDELGDSHVVTNSSSNATSSSSSTSHSANQQSNVAWVGISASNAATVLAVTDITPVVFFHKS